MSECILGLFCPMFTGAGGDVKASGCVGNLVLFDHFPRFFAGVELVHSLKVFAVFALDVVHNVGLWLRWFKACRRALRSAESVRV